MSRTILVTGASKGIGRAIAIRLAQDGFHIVVHYGKDRAGAEETLAAIQAANSQGRLLSCDVADRAQCRERLETDLDQHGPYYGAVLNAGITRDGAFPALSETDWDQVLTTNLDGFFNILHPLVMPMVSARKGGRIVALSSVSGLIGNRGQVNYAAAKAGIVGAVKSLAIELAKRAITVNCVAPGLIETAMTEDLPTEEILKVVPLRRMGRPEEVAAAVAFLCSDEAAYITRQVISVNGGMI
ncbi:MAG TPA: 3-oxoacyl-ACP reductase FabG [Hypericibacter adhaerens]|jgi:3-oxoacyl-[acyl-carrier protein] reductase|uniref:Beta-ketoacyl-ACP reductase n=1 Tax=Hypericibacter adhaerens TaxID=2602016 RepID=A0A5J6N318_9PROT|nr:3-oxoacyl-ACP reductase FabG [Hypericibacter adhaerens]QEX22990.1 beta-ketoacyl-ACP reductase [Hypericibacter adhaerens]HWA44278.1 3-oxoacyl-ACP reductase FabG [Hypericibacter adhaerens]